MEKNSLQLKLNSEQTLIARDVPSQRILEIGIQAPSTETPTNRAKLNLALIIDKSGSMSGSRLEYAKQAALYVVDRLEEKDRVALVMYDDRVEVLSASIQMTPANRAEIKSKIRNIRIGGTTNLSGGWLEGCQQVAAVTEETSINRSLLLTDGLANVGIVDLEELSMHAGELAKRGVSTSTFGVGQGFNEHLLEAMANKGRGNFYYIEAPMEIPDIFLREFKELSSITAADVEIILDVPKQVDFQILGGWSHDKKDGKIKIFAGNLFSDQHLELYARLLTPPANEISEIPLTAKVIARNELGQVVESQAALVFKYADQDEVRKEPIKHDVMGRYASVELADKTTEALKLERLGERESAYRVMNQTIMSNMPYLSSDQEEKYRNMSERMKRGMQEGDRKSSQYDSYQSKRRRNPKQD
jgi:Ca-activated chloride channel family protein